MNMYKEGSLCLTEWPFVAYTICAGDTKTYDIFKGETFILLDAVEIEENNVIEFQILYENMKMWFNIHMNDYRIGNVRRAESYDIPFMTLQETELGSNTLIS